MLQLSAVLRQTGYEGYWHICGSVIQRFVQFIQFFSQGHPSFRKASKRAAQGYTQWRRLRHFVVNAGDYAFVRFRFPEFVTNILRSTHQQCAKLVNRLRVGFPSGNADNPERFTRTGLHFGYSFAAP